MYASFLIVLVAAAIISPVSTPETVAGRYTEVVLDIDPIVTHAIAAADISGVLAGDAQLVELQSSQPARLWLQPTYNQVWLVQGEYGTLHYLRTSLLDPWLLVESDDTNVAVRSYKYTTLSLENSWFATLTVVPLTDILSGVPEPSSAVLLGVAVLFSYIKVRQWTSTKNSQSLLQK